MTYSVQVFFDGSWLFVHHGDQIMTFDNYDDAELFANTWRITGKEENVEVVPTPGD